MDLEITQIIGYLAEPAEPEGMKSGAEQEQMSEEEWKDYMMTLPEEWYQFPNQYETGGKTVPGNLIWQLHRKTAMHGSSR